MTAGYRPPLVMKYGMPPPRQPRVPTFGERLYALEVEAIKRSTVPGWARELERRIEVLEQAARVAASSKKKKRRKRGGA